MHLRPNPLGTIEIVLNAELQQQLQSTDMKLVLRGKTKEDNDRIQRYKDLLKDCNTASECLLKLCSYFDFNPNRSVEGKPVRDAMHVDGDDSFSTHSDGAKDKPSHPASPIAEDCLALISLREKQMESLVKELESNLLHAAWLRKQCERATKKEEQGLHYDQWKAEIENNSLRDPTATSDLRRYIAAAHGHLTDEKLDAETEEIYYRNPLTKEQKAEERKAATKRKNWEKARSKASKAKKGKQGKRGKKSNADQDSADITEPPLPDLRADKIGRDDFKAYNSALRKLTGHLRGLANELASRTRSLRFARSAYAIHEWHNNPNELLTCAACNKFILDGNKININIGCGHLTCDECIHQNVDDLCAVDGCRGQSEAFCLRKAADFVGNGQTGNYGSKVGHIIALINSIPEGEQILLFVQFDKVMLKLASALEAANISNYALNAEKDGKEMFRMLNDFQENEGQDKKKVLLLDPSGETAAGM